MILFYRKRVDIFVASSSSSVICVDYIQIQSEQKKFFFNLNSFVFFFYSLKNLNDFFSSSVLCKMFILEKKTFLYSFKFFNMPLSHFYFSSSWCNIYCLNILFKMFFETFIFLPHIQHKVIIGQNCFKKNFFLNF